MINWEHVLCKILHAFGEQEGTWYEYHWDVSEEEHRAVREAYERYVLMLEGEHNGTQDDSERKGDRGH